LVSLPLHLNIAHAKVVTARPKRSQQLRQGTLLACFTAHFIDQDRSEWPDPKHETHSHESRHTLLFKTRTNELTHQGVKRERERAWPSGLRMCILPGQVANSSPASCLHQLFGRLLIFFNILLAYGFSTSPCTPHPKGRSCNHPGIVVAMSSGTAINSLCQGHAGLSSSVLFAAKHHLRLAGQVRID
jgi:hypothetical protein